MCCSFQQFGKIYHESFPSQLTVRGVSTSTAAFERWAFGAAHIASEFPARRSERRSMQSTRESLLSILVRARERISAFEIELRCAQWASMPGPVHSETAHELRGGLNAIVLQVGAIKLSSECDSQDLAREIEALERDLRRLKLALKQCLEHDAPATRIEEAFG